MTAVAPLDAMFLVGESREHPMHGGGLMLFDLPEGAGRDHLARLYREMVDPALTVNPMFGRRMRHSLANLGYWSW